MSCEYCWMEFCGERKRGEVEVGRKKEDDREGGGGKEGEVERKEE